VNENGLYADIHAIRHTFVTIMVKSSVHPKTAHSLASHSTIELTMNAYASLAVHDPASAWATLPAVPAFHQDNATALPPKATSKDGPKKVPAMVPKGAANGAQRPSSGESPSARDCTENGDGAAKPRRAQNANTPGENGGVRVSSHRSASSFPAEREGFEPSNELPRCRFSRPVHSAALPPLREAGDGPAPRVE